MPLSLGSRAPDFALRSHTGELVRLSDIARERAVVLYFYPRDETSGCTAEACAFRDRYEEFRKAGAEVIGISADPVKTHEAFARHHHLGFVLLSDPDGAVRRLYQVADTIPHFVPGRETFVIDQLVIVHRFSSQIRPTAHVRKALRIIEQIGAARGAGRSR